MRRILLVSLLFLIVLGAALFATAGYLLHDEQFLKARLHALVLNATGRELAIDGPLRLELGAESTIEAQGIRLQNAAWAGRDDMLELGHLRVTLDLRSLFTGTPVIPSLLLEDCSLLFARREDGSGNWQPRPAPTAADRPAGETDGGPAVLLREVSVHNCRLDFEGPQRAQPLAVSVAEIELALQEGDRWQASGNGRVRACRSAAAWRRSAPSCAADPWSTTSKPYLEA
jgi:uncharacterized protein involved in outer membrane biogenesis